MLTTPFFQFLVGLLQQEAADGAFFVAVGSGSPDWDSGLPADDRSVAALVEEIARQPVPAEQIVFLDEQDQPTETPTTRLQFPVTFEPGEGTGTLRECGLFGGEATEELGSGTLLSYFTNARIEKTPDMELERIIRIDLTPRAIVPGTRETRFLGNTASTELHDLDNITPNCQIDEIRFDRRFFFANVDEATQAGYDFCAYCFGRELSER